MTRILAALAICLALPATAGQDNRAWWECTIAYLGARNLVTGSPLGMIALDATMACRDLSLQDTAGDDLDVVKQLIERYRGYHNEGVAADGKLR